MKSKRFIGIAGGSCSGKTVLAERLGIRLLDLEVGRGGEGSEVRECPVISIDSYYLGLADATGAEIERYNFDDPAALDHDLLVQHLSLLASGRPADIPVYDFSTHLRTSRVRRVELSAFVIVEGLFSLYWDDVRALFDTKVFIDVPHEVCLARRIERDTRDRGRPRDEVIRRYDTMARPTYDQNVLPSRSHADVVVDGTRPVDESVDRVMSVIEGRV